MADHTPGEARAEPGAARFTVRLALITALGAAWRLGYLFAVKADASLQFNDSLYYSIQASRNAEGDWFRESLSQLPGAEHGPLTSLYLTPWSIGTGAYDVRQRFAMTLLGIATVAVLGLLGRRLAGARVGLVAAALAAAYPNLWINDSLIMAESLACLLVSAALLVAVGFDRRPGFVAAAVLGLLAGLAALTRSELALLAPGFAALAWWRASGHARRPWLAVVVLAASASTVAPWVVYNVARFDEPVLLTTNDGTTLLGANCDTTYYRDIGGWEIACLEPVPDDVVDASVRARARRDVAFDYIGAHLRRLPLVVAARLGRTLDVYGLESLVYLDTGEEKAEWAVWAGIAAWWLLAAAAVIGWRHAHRHGGRAAEDSRARWWLAVPPATVLVVTVLFYGAHRIRAPAEPVVVVLAAVGLVTIGEAVAARRSGRRSGAAST